MQDRGVHRGRAGHVTINTSAKNIVQAVIEVRLLLGARKGAKLCRVEIGFKLLFPRPKGGSGSVVL